MHAPRHWIPDQYTWNRDHSGDLWGRKIPLNAKGFKVSEFENSLFLLPPLNLRHCRLAQPTACPHQQIFSKSFQILGNFSDFWKLFRFSENFQIFGKFLDFGKIFSFLENSQILGNFSGFGKFSEFWKILRISKKIRFLNLVGLSQSGHVSS